MKAAFNIGILTVLLLAILVSGCSSDTTYVPPSKAEPLAAPSQEQTPASVPTQGNPSIPQAQVQQQEAVSQPEPPKVTIFKVGETASDGELKVTVNTVRFVNFFRGDSEYSVSKASAGNEYAILDLSIENVLADKTQRWYSGNTEIIDQDGYTYDAEFSSFYLPKYLPPGEILPGMKKRGEVAYEVSANATALKFIYKFDTFEGTSAVFDIK